MIICSRPECSSTAGCKCGNGWPWQYPQMPAYTTGGVGRASLSDFSDEEIAREYHSRALRKLGDQSVSVGFAGLPAHLHAFGGRRRT